MNLVVKNTHTKVKIVQTLSNLHDITIWHQFIHSVLYKSGVLGIYSQVGCGYVFYFVCSPELNSNGDSAQITN